MTSVSTKQLLKAQWILPMTGEPQKDFALLIEAGNIVSVAPSEQLQTSVDAKNHQVKDYGKAIIVPGLINLHTHLDYSFLASFKNGKSLLPWTRALMEAVVSWQSSDWLESAREGTKAAARRGTTFLVDSSYSGSAAKAIAESGLKGLVGLELFGVDESKTEEVWSRWIKKYQGLVSSGDDQLNRALNGARLSITAAPHAPYTVCPALWKKAKDWAVQNDKPLLTHLAESQHECRWFLNDDEEMSEHLRFAFGSFRGGPPVKDNIFTWKQSGYSPVEHLERYHLLNSDLIAAHAVAVSDSDLSKLGSHGVSIAHCPRSNARLRNGYAPLEKMRSKGLKIGLGTDSLASCEDLDMLAEARFAVALNQALNPTTSYGAKQALEAITIEAARCLNKADQIGSLEPAKRADLAIFEIPRQSSDQLASPELDPYELLLAGNCQLLELFVDGVSIYKRGHDRIADRQGPAHPPK